MKRASRLLLLRFLAPHQKVSKHIGFYRVFGSSALEQSAKKEAAQKWAPRGLQDAFWAPKSGPKRRPRGPQEAPKTPQEAPKTPPRGPLGPQNRPQEPPRRPQDAPRSPQIAPQRPQSCIFQSKSAQNKKMPKIIAYPGTSVPASFFYDPVRGFSCGLRSDPQTRVQKVK